jgi:hypothetical protein
MNTWAFKWMEGPAGKVKGLMDRIEPKVDPAWGLPAQTWANPTFALFCLAFLLGTMIHPPEGLPFRLCALHQVLGVDCPGCGMTRGLSQLWRGHFIMAIGNHPFSPLVFAFLVFQSMFLVLSKKTRLDVVQVLNRHETGIRWLFWVSAGSFLAFGVFRAAAECAGLF